MPRVEVEGTGCNAIVRVIEEFHHDKGIITMRRWWKAHCLFETLDKRAAEAGCDFFSMCEREMQRMIIEEHYRLTKLN